MNPPGIDIIVPIWNRPEETRHCLTRLAQHTPGARFILMDNASERETELLLQEFAEALGERALLFRNEKTDEFVVLVNRGLARAEAPVMGLVKNTTMVREGWLEPLLETFSCRPDAGLAVPELVAGRAGTPAAKKAPTFRPIEIPHADFAVFLMVRKLYEHIGGFDEELDGGIWCLKDYSRRAWKEGFVTVSVSGAPVLYGESTPLGSQARREERLRESIARYTARWGREQSYCLDMSADIELDAMVNELEILLGSARLGHSITVLARPRMYREIVRAGYDLLHKNIVIERLPSFFPDRAARKALASLRRNDPGVKMIKNTTELFFHMANGHCPPTGGQDAE